MPSSKRIVVEVLLYAAFLTTVVSRRLLALVRRRLAAMADRIPEQRWASVFVAVAHELLTVATHPLAAGRSESAREPIPSPTLPLRGGDRRTPHPSKPAPLDRRHRRPFSRRSGEFHAEVEAFLTRCS